MAKKMIVGCSPLTNKLYAGTLNKDNTWSADKQDVTDTAVLAVAQHLLKTKDGGIQFEYSGTEYQMRILKVKKS